MRPKIIRCVYLTCLGKDWVGRAGFCFFQLKCAFWAVIILHQQRLCIYKGKKKKANLWGRTWLRGQGERRWEKEEGVEEKRRDGRKEEKDGENTDKIKKNITL